MLPRLALHDSRLALSLEPDDDADAEDGAVVVVSRLELSHVVVSPCSI